MSYCDCSKCYPMDSDEESYCCQELTKTRIKPTPGKPKQEVTLEVHYILHIFYKSCGVFFGQYLQRYMSVIKNYKYWVVYKCLLLFVDGLNCGDRWCAGANIINSRLFFIGLRRSFGHFNSCWWSISLALIPHVYSTYVAYILNII